MTISIITIPEDIAKLMAEHAPKGHLEHTARLILKLFGVNHARVKMHVENVARLSVIVGEEMEKDCNAILYSALLHDLGKLFLPADFFSGRDISMDEYGEVKKHAVMAYQAIGDEHMFVALCASLHHAMYEKGYGLSMADFPEGLQPRTVKKVLEIATIISVCDFIEAFTHRETTPKDGVVLDLPKALKEKYPDDHLIVEKALEAAAYLNWL